MSNTDHTPAAVLEADKYLGDYHVYEPHRAGIPPQKVYLRELWKRRHFAVELSRSTMRAAHTNTFFGQVWLVLNPLLLALVYFILVDLLSGASRGASYFAHLLAGLFAFYFIAGAMTAGASSVVGGGKLIMNMAFPRLLLPLSAVRTAFFRFLPTLIIYFVLHFLAGLPITPATALALPILVLITLFASAMACLFGTAQVYFRDVSSFLPYINRIWLYLSPVILTVAAIHGRLAHHGISWLAYLNPLYPLLGSWSMVLSESQVPPPSFWVASIIWSFGSFVLAALFFMSREREFAVRL